MTDALLKAAQNDVDVYHRVLAVAHLTAPSSSLFTDLRVMGPTLRTFFVLLFFFGGVFFVLQPFACKDSILFIYIILFVESAIAVWKHNKNAIIKPSSLNNHH